MIQFITEQPSWYIIFCIALGAGYAFLLYRNEKSLGEIQQWLKKLMMGLRFLFVTILSFLLLTPLIKTLSRETEKPIVIIAQDNSQSIAMNKDSAFYRHEYPQKMNAMMDELKKKYDVKSVSFGDVVKDNADYSYTDKQTDFTSLMNELNVRYSNRNVGAVVIASDGLYNRGSNPVFSSADLKVPVYTIALGDTTVQKDLLIGNIRFNKIVYLGNSFPVEINVDARQCNGAATTLTLNEDSATLFTKAISITGNKFNTLVPVFLDAKKKGMHHYKIAVSPVSGEMTTANNTKDIFIEVLESKQKILIVADAPHPDLAALKTSIESNENYEVKTVMIDKFDGKVNEYSLVILHQLPSTDHSAADVISKITAAKIPVLYILGTETNINAFNAAATGVNISSSINKANELQASVAENFSLFTLSKETQNAVRAFPPLIAPYGEYKTKANDYTLLNQQIGSVTSNQPLLTFNESSESKIGVLCGTGVWHWRMYDYMTNNNFTASDELITKVVQYLATKETKSHFRIITKNIFTENEPVQMDAEVYDDNYTLINTPDIAITITNTGKKTFPYTFSKTDKAYSLNAGYFPSGSYNYKATVKTGEKVYSSEGAFTVTALQVELNETMADHQMLYALAKKNGGELFYPSQLDALAKNLKARDDIKTVSYTHYKMQDLVNMKFIFFLLLAFISVEWFLRKRSGAY